MFGRPEGASVCECERVQSSSLAQSLHLMNAAEVKTKLATSNGTADRLAKSDVPEPEKLRGIYLAAFSREPRAEEMQTLGAYLAKSRFDVQGKPLDPPQAKRQAYEDILWALINTKEFLYNH